MCCLPSESSTVRIYQVPVLSSETAILLVSTKNYNLWLEPLFWAYLEYSFLILSEAESDASQTVKIGPARGYD